MQLQRRKEGEDCEVLISLMLVLNRNNVPNLVSGKNKWHTVRHNLYEDRLHCTGLTLLHIFLVTVTPLNRSGSGQLFVDKIHAIKIKPL